MQHWENVILVSKQVLNLNNGKILQANYEPFLGIFRHMKCPGNSSEQTAPRDWCGAWC